MTSVEYIKKYLLGKLCLCVKTQYDKKSVELDIRRNSYVFFLEVTQEKHSFTVKVLNKNNIQHFSFHRKSLYNSQCDIVKYFELIK